MHGEQEEAAMAEQQEPLGQQVGEYRLLHLLGKGSFGAVYLAERLHNHSQAAVKLLRFHLISPEDFKEFLNEARTIRLRHRHIIPLLDFGLTRENTPYLVMEYAEGGTLRQHCPEGTKLPFETLDSYVTQLASALQYAHDHRVIHRDVKPANVLVRADGTLLLSDFGIAKVLEQSSFVSLQAQAGTPAYMAPEQSQGKPCPASDQYSLAVMVYGWLAGRLPFQGAGLEVIVQHRLDEPPSLQEFSPEVPMQVEQVVMQALAKKPEERFSTVEQFAQTLHAAFQESSSTDARGQSGNVPGIVGPLITASQMSIESALYHDQNINDSVACVFSVDQDQIMLPVSPSEMSSASVSLGEVQTSLPPTRNTRTIPQSLQLPIQPPPVRKEALNSHGSHTTSLSEPVDCTPLTPDIFSLSAGDLPSSNSTHLSKNRISRRTVVASLAGVAGISLVGGGIIWLTTIGKLEGSISSSLTPTVPFTHSPSPTITTMPVSRLLYTYRGQAQAPFGIYSAVWSPDSTRIASSAGTVHIWDATNGGHVLTHHASENTYNNSQGLAWSPDGTRIVSIENLSMEVWTAKDGTFIAGHQSPLGWGDALSWSPDNQRIVSGSDEQPGSAEIWDAASGQTMLTYRGHVSPVRAVAWSPNGKWIVSASMGKLVHVWDATNAQQVYIYSGHPVNEVSSVAWSSDSRRVASAGNDGTVHVWDAADGGHVYIYRGHFHASDQYHTVTTVAWSPDGTRIASGDWNHLVQIWDAVSGNQIYTYTGHSDYITSVAWSSDGKRIASASRDGTVQVWQAP